MQVGMIGLGPMGRGIAKNILREFESITIPENRAKDSVDELRSLGASVTSIEGLVDHASQSMEDWSSRDRCNDLG
jgi:3-hydroxyisobutyrate dehydrogenase-like beta-hydroxyacid dehydrogenase